MIQDFKNKTIMIVDDEPEILEIMTDMIKSQLDLNISTYTSSSAALESFKEGLLPNLILTDIKMPKQSGLEFIAKLKKLNVRKPIIVISGHAEKKEAIECLKLGVFNLLDKPLTFEILIHSILQALTLEEVEINNECLNIEKEVLIGLFQNFTSKSEERISEAENLVLDKTRLIQDDKNILKNFLGRINECSSIDREITKTYKVISKLLQRQNEIITKNISQEFFQKYFKTGKKTKNI